MKETVNLTQLYKSPAPYFVGANCLLSNNTDDRFECKIDMPEAHKKQLWQFVKGNWDGLMCLIEFNDVTSNGIPINAIVKSVIGFTPLN